MCGNDNLVDSTKASGKVMYGSARKVSRRGGEKKRAVHACSICSKAKVSEVGGGGGKREGRCIRVKELGGAEMTDCNASMLCWTTR